MEAPGHVPSVPSPKSGTVVRLIRLLLELYYRVALMPAHTCQPSVSRTESPSF